MKIFFLVLLLIATPSIYILTQQPRLSLNAEQFGLMLCKGRYRSWYLSFCDGKMIQNGKMVPVIMELQPDGSTTARPGYRIIPKFRHLDMRNFPFTKP